MVRSKSSRDRACSPFVLLRTQSGRRPTGTALAMADHLSGDVSGDLSWGELFREVEDLAAGLLSSGVREGQVALISMSPGRDCVVVELALRAIGVVPSRLAADVAAAVAAATFTASPVSLVVVDRADLVETFAGLPLGRAKLLDTSLRDNVAGLVAAGRALLRQEPAVVSRVDQRLLVASTTPRLITADGSPVAAPTEPDRSTLLTPRDRVLLVGHPHDPFTQHIRTAALAAGATLGWIAGAEALAQALQQVRPTVLAIDAATTSAITAQVADGRIEGRVWHAHPTAVIEAVAAIATRDSPPRGRGGVRRRSPSSGRGSAAS